MTKHQKNCAVFIMSDIQEKWKTKAVYISECYPNINIYVKFEEIAFSLPVEMSKLKVENLSKMCSEIYIEVRNKIIAEFVSNE